MYELVFKMASFCSRETYLHIDKIFAAEQFLFLNLYLFKKKKLNLCQTIKFLVILIYNTVECTLKENFAHEIYKK